MNYVGYAVESHAERETAVLVGIDTAVFENSAVYHARAQYFNPARVFTDSAAFSVTIETRYVHLDARFRKREITRAKTYLGLRAENKFRKALERTFKIA